MKRKIFSKLLMGALLVASVSSFTSCKDYDDDINSLKDDVAKRALLSDVTALQTKVDGVKTTADQALANAATNATSISGVKTDLAAVKAIADKAAGDAAQGIKDAADAKTAADVAQKAADDAKAALADYAKTSDLADYVKNSDLETTLADYVKASALAEAVADAKQQIETFIATSEGNFEALKADVEKFKGAYSQIWNAVTSVSLYAAISPANNPSTTTWDEGAQIFYPAKVLGLTFCLDKIDKADKRFTRFDGAATKGDGLFGDPSNKDYFNATANYSASKVTFTDGAEFKFPTSLIVRVSPTNATLSASDIKLIDGAGTALSQVEVAAVTPYTNIFTRGGSASGLWKVELQAVAKATNDKFNAETRYSSANSKKDKAGDKKVLFAVAINNTSDVEAAADRAVVSEYGLTIENDPIYAYTGCYSNEILAGKVGTDIMDAVVLSQVAARYPGAATGIVGAKPAAVENKWVAGDAGNNVNMTGDDRHAATKIIKINSGGTVTVDLTTVVNARNFTPQYYYVVRDDANAGGSDASELNAWTRYTYSGDLGKILDPATEKCSFSITIPENLLTGDYIGFRIFAVNYDGTLCDPDGVPFEVWVGSAKSSQSITQDFTPTQQANQTFDYAFTPTVKTGDFVPNGTIDLKNGSTDYNPTDWNWEFLDADKVALTAADSFDDVAYIRFTSTDVTKWKDGQTGTGTIEFTEGTNTVPVNVINVALTKVMPTTFKAHWKESQPGDPANTNNYICYVEPNQTAGTFTTKWDATAAQGFKYMTQAIQDLANDAVTDNHYQFVIENMNLDANNAYTEPGYFPLYTNGTPANPLYVWAAPKLVDNTSVTHSAKWYYVYTNISSENTDKSAYNGESNNADKKNNDWYVEGTPFTITYACALNPSVMKYSWVKELEVTVNTWFPELIVNNPSVVPTTKVIAKVTDVYAVYNQQDKVYVDLEYTYNGVTYKNTTRKNLSTANDLTKLIAYENSFDNAWFLNGANKMFAGGQYYVDGTSAVPSLGSYIGASVTNNSNGEAQYFTAAVDAAGKISLTPTSTTQPENAIPSTLTLKGYDAFGHVHEIAKLPFNVHRN